MIWHHRAPEPPPIFSTFHYAGDIIRTNAARPSAPPSPSPKRLPYDWVRGREARDEKQAARIDAIRNQSAALAIALDLADEFAALIRKRSSGTLAEWLRKGEASDSIEFHRFAEGIRRDEAAVLVAVTESWSNGPVEGQVNRLKAIMRQRYGRAEFALLRAGRARGVAA